MKKRKPLVAWLFIAVVLTGFLLLAMLPPATSAQLPGRATPTADLGKSDDQITGARIELQVWGAPRGTWAVVQWQRADGVWADVDGWCSQLNYGSAVSWWVGPKDFGTGPFRWLVADGAHGSVLTASDPFMLPAAVNETLRVELTLP